MVIDGKSNDLYLGHIFIETQAVGVKNGYPFYPAENHGAVSQFQVTGAIKLIALQSVRRREVFGRYLPNMEAAQSFAGTQPDKGLGIFCQNAVHHIIWKPLGGFIVFELIRFFVQAVQSALGAYPEVSLGFERVISYAHHNINGQRSVVSRVVPEIIELVASGGGYCFCQTIQPKYLDCAIFVFVQKIRKECDYFLRFVERELGACFGFGVKLQ